MKRSSRSVKGGSTATEQAPIEAIQRVQTKQRQHVTNRVWIQLRLAVQDGGHLAQQVVGGCQSGRHGFLIIAVSGPARAATQP